MTNFRQEFFKNIFSRAFLNGILQKKNFQDQILTEIFFKIFFPTPILLSLQIFYSGPIFNRNFSNIFFQDLVITGNFQKYYFQDIFFKRIF